MKIILSAVLMTMASTLCFAQGKVAPPPTVTPMTILGIMGPVREVGAALATTASVAETEGALSPTVTTMTILAIMPMPEAGSGSPRIEWKPAPPPTVTPMTIIAIMPVNK